MKRYLLAIERNHNDYIPIDMALLSEYIGKEVSTLADIDFVTSEIPEDELKQFLVRDNIISMDDFDKNLVVLFEEKGKTRKLVFDTVRNEELKAISIKEISDFITGYHTTSEIINNIYNHFKDKNISKDFREFIENLKGIKNIHVLAQMKRIEGLPSIPYDERRELGLLISRVLIPKLEKENEAKLMVTKRGD